MGSRVFLWVAIVVIAIGFLYLVRSILLPFVVGIFASALLDPAIRKLRMKGFSRGAAAWTVFIAFIVVAGGVLTVVVPLAAAQLGDVQRLGSQFLYRTVLPGGLIRFYADAEVAKAVRRKEWPRDPGSLRLWLSDISVSDSDVGEFFSQMGSRLQAYSVPQSREGILDKYGELTRPGIVDAFFENNKAWLARLNLPTSAAEADERFQIRAQFEQRLQNFVGSAFGGAAAIVEYLASSILLVIITPVVTLLFLLDYDNFRRRFVTWIPPSIRPAATDLLGDMGDVLGQYLRGLTLSVALYTTITAVVLFVLGVPYALFLAMIFGVFYLIPYVGYWVSMLLLLLAVVGSEKTGPAFVSFGSTTTYAAVCLGVFLVVNLIYDQLAHPNIVGRSIGLNPIVSLFVVFSGYALFGLAGMILAFPIAGMIKVILDRLIRYTTTSQPQPPDLPRVPSRHQT